MLREGGSTAGYSNDEFRGGMSGIGGSVRGLGRREGESRSGPLLHGSGEVQCSVHRFEGTATQRQAEAEVTEGFGSEKGLKQSSPNPETQPAAGVGYNQATPVLLLTETQDESSPIRHRLKGWDSSRRRIYCGGTFPWH
jgi:hypothetical protein